MTRLSIPLLAAAFCLAAAPASAAEKGVLTVRDGGKVFTAEGVARAVRAFEAVPFRQKATFAVESFDKIPAAMRADYDTAKDDPAARNRFFAAWAREAARDGGSPNLFVLISVEGSHVRAINDRETAKSRDFTPDDLQALAAKFTAGFRTGRDAPDAAAKSKANDDALLAATTFAADQFQETAGKAANAPRRAAADGNAGAGGTGLMGYVCIGLSLLLGAWLVVGLFRALTGGGGSGMGGGGMGGGGFMTGLMGGLFGAVAGHYLYDNFFGGSSSASAADGAGGSDFGGDTGAGDYGGGGDAGGDFGDAGGDVGGDFGGGDW